MKHYLSTLTRAFLLALTSSPLATAACYAKDLTQAELANMAQASAARIGCGITIGVANDITDVGPIYTGVFMICALVAIAVRIAPKPMRQVCWRIIRSVALIYFYSFAITSVGSAIFGAAALNGAVALWLVSALIALPMYFRSLLRTYRTIFTMTVNAAGWAIKQFNNVYVRVDGNTVTLKQRFRSQTRVVEESPAAATEQTDEAQACLL